MTARILVGDALAMLATLPDASVQCCVTSPPYWNLRDYGTGAWEGGDADCVHQIATRHQAQGATSQRRGRANQQAQRNETYQRMCHACGATRVDQQIGLEATPAAYVERLVTVFREVRRVLHPRGTLWLNLAPSYAGSGKGMWANKVAQKEVYVPDPGDLHHVAPVGYKSKDLIPIPWLVAMALQADGWWLRSEIIWHKPNAMPSSVQDRPTLAHEQLFLFTKSAKYFYDAAAIAEPNTEEMQRRAEAGHTRGGRLDGRAPNRHDHESLAAGRAIVADGRNARTVWSVNTEPFTVRSIRGYTSAEDLQEHYAVMASAIARRCILAGSADGDTVLDPFCGVGTTLLVADQLGRHGVGIELDPATAQTAAARLRNAAPLLADVAIARPDGGEA